MKFSKKLLLILSTSALLASCGGNSSSKHSHVFSDVYESDASQHWYVCEECLEKIDIADHVYDQQVADAKYLASNATCLDNATYYKSCVCGAFDSHGETFTSGNPLGHDFQAAYLDQGPTKVNYQAGETFDWTGVVIKRACGRTGCSEVETLDNSLFTVVYDNGNAFAPGDNKVTLTSANEEPIIVSGLNVAKKSNQIIGPDSLSTVCGVAPDLSVYSSTSGDDILATYYKDGEECLYVDIAKNAGVFTAKLATRENPQYETAEKIVSISVEHDGNDVCECGVVFKETVSFPTFRKVVIDLSGDSVIDLTTCELDFTKTYTSAKLYVGETEVSATFADNKLTVSKDNLPEGLTAGEHDDIKVVVEASDYSANIVGSVLVATKVINTVEDFKYNCSTIFTTNSTSGAKNVDFAAGEYYVLGNDLDATSKWTYKVNGASKAIWHSSGLASFGQGFKGTFDGNNYSIVGGDLGTTSGDNTFGMFGALGTGSVVKNLNITGVKYRGTQYTCILAHDMDTTLDNVFIEAISDYAAGSTLPATSGNYGVVNTASASVRLNNTTIVIRNSDGTGYGKALFAIRSGNGSGAISATGSAICGECLTTYITGVTVVSWELDNINTQLTFVWKAAENMYRILLHGGNTQYNRVVVAGKVLAPSQYNLWYNDNGTAVLDIPSEYMNAGDVIYVTKTANGNAARGVAPSKN